VLSGGGLHFGIGAGWNREEMGRIRARGCVCCASASEAMQAIRTQDEASYGGRFVRFERIS
jgi:hypothetical protein